ncbi:hypothetical protein [Streptomyces sp. NPDC056628]|uniref:hypothetical protein n=1 Tax=Streptomyces sp. NPDC056628 TaxID=3345882 RepID=UPI00369DA51F
MAWITVAGSWGVSPTYSQRPYRSSREGEEVGNPACDRYDGYPHPRFDSAPPPSGEAPTGPTTDPYDRSKGIPEDRREECGVVSRT